MQGDWNSVFKKLAKFLKFGFNLIQKSPQFL